MKAKILLSLLALAAFFPRLARADELEPPVPVRTVAPDYPEEMRRNGRSGVVTVNCLVDEKGNVQEPRVERSSDSAFSQPALDAIKKWRFKPAKKDGSAIALRINIPIQFSTDH